jgi:hypothetical protein
MIETRVGILNVPELEALVSLNVDLARRYQAIADDMDGEPSTRLTAQALATWRRARARYFQHESAETERVEAADEQERCSRVDLGPRPADTRGPPAGPSRTVSAAPRSGGLPGRGAATQRQHRDTA